MSNPEPAGVDEYANSKPAAPAAGGGVNFGTLYGIDAATANVPIQGSSGSVNARAAERGEEDPRSQPAPNQLTTTIGAIIQALSGLSTKNRKDLQDKLIRGGFLPKNYVINGAMEKDFVRGFTEMLTEFARANQLPETDASGAIEGYVNWMSYLDSRAVDNEQAEAKAKKKADAETNPPKVELINYNMAAPAYKEAFRAAVGRDPSDSEINAFVDSYNAKAKENPLVTKVEMKDGVEVTTHEGGVSEDFMSDQIEENADYANYQAVATYFPAMERILGGNNLNLIQGI